MLEVGRGTRSGRFRSIAAAQRREGGGARVVGGNICRRRRVRAVSPPLPAPPPAPGPGPALARACSLPRCVWQAGGRRWAAMGSR